MAPARAVIGAHARAVIGGLTRAVIGHHARAVIGTRARAVIGVHARAVRGTRARAQSLADTRAQSLANTRARVYGRHISMMHCASGQMTNCTWTDRALGPLLLPRQKWQSIYGDVACPCASQVLSEGRKFGARVSHVWLLRCALSPPNTPVRTVAQWAADFNVDGSLVVGRTSVNNARDAFCEILKEFPGHFEAAFARICLES